MLSPHTSYISNMASRMLFATNFQSRCIIEEKEPAIVGWQISRRRPAGTDLSHLGGRLITIKEKSRSMHILVVEDEQRLALLLRRVLLEERHTVDLAHD